MSTHQLVYNRTRISRPSALVCVLRLFRSFGCFCAVIEPIGAGECRVLNQEGASMRLKVGFVLLLTLCVVLCQQQLVVLCFMVLTA